MTHLHLTRRAALLGAAASLGGCSAIAALDSAATPLDVYDLTPVAGSVSGVRTSRTLLVVEPTAPAALGNDRMLIRPGGQSIAYLPEARWSDTVPLLLQSLLIRAIGATGRVGFVGPSGSGPVPDVVLLARIDRFDASVGADGVVKTEIDADFTLLRDIDQSILASRRFTGQAQAAGDTPAAIAAAFDQILSAILPAAADWAIAGTAR